MKFLERFAKTLERFMKFSERFTKTFEQFMKFTERFAKTFERFIKFSERFVKMFERFMKITERFGKTFERFMKFPIEIIFSRELSVGYLFRTLTKPFEGCSVTCYLHLSFERYDEPFAKIHKPFKRFVEPTWLCIL